MPLVSCHPDAEMTECLLLPGGVQNIVCDECVCLSVHLHISKTTWPNITKFLCIFYASVLLCQHCNTLCTSGFVDDVMFSHNGPCGVSYS